MPNIALQMTLPETALTLCEQWGFSVFPLHPKSKKPVLSWTEYQTRAASPDEIEDWWEEDPARNIAIACGKVSNLVVVDADNQQAIEWVKANFIQTPVAVKTRRGFHYYYKYPHGSEAWLKAEREKHKTLKDGVDIQIDGFYVVGPNSIHPNGDIYTLYEHIPGAWEDELVPELQMATDIVAQSGGIDLSDVPDFFSELGQGSRHDAILKYVGALIAKGLPYAEVLQKAREEAAARCAQSVSDPFTDKEIVSIVRSTFKSHERNHPQTATTVNGGEDMATDMTGVKLADIQDEAQDEWPEEILHPGGLLEKLADYTEASAARTERIFAVGGAVSCLGAVASQRVCNVSGLRTNMYILLVGRSSSGKDAPRKAIIRLLKAGSSDMAALFGGSDISSDTSILTYLNRDNCRRSLFVIDEIGLFFKNTKNPNSPKCNIIKVLTELYSKSNDGHIKRYANQENDIVIPWLSLSLLGMSVPSELWPSLNSGETTNGFLSRCFVIESKSDYRESKDEDDVLLDLPEDIVQGLQHIWNIDVGDKKPQQKDEKGVEIVLYPQPWVIKFDKDAKAYHKGMKRQTEEDQKRATDRGDDAGASIYGRNNEHAIKLALIKFLSDNYQKSHDEIRKSQVTLDQVRWAWLFTCEKCRRTLESMAGNIHSSDFEMYQQKVFKIIKSEYLRNKKKGINKPGATLSVLSRKITELDKRQLQAVLDKGVQANMLRLVLCGPGTSGGRPCYVYAITEEID